MLFSPERVALAGVLTYLVLWLIAPLDIVHRVSWGSLIYVVLCYCGFFLGCLLAAGGSRRVVPPQARKGFTKRMFWTIAALGMAGMALRFYDKLFLRGINLADAALESRELLADAEAGPLAAIGGMLYPMCYIPLILWWARPAGMDLSKKAKWMAVVLFLLPAIDALMLLSRSQMLVALSMMYFSAACVLYRGRPFSKRLVKLVIIGVLGLGFISAYAFSNRLSQMEMDVIFSILNSAYGYVLTPSASILSLMNDGSSLAGQFLVALVPIVQYYLHGLFEFGLLWGRPDHQAFSFGAQLFAPYVKMLAIFHAIEYPDFKDVDLYYRSGVFTTFFGPLWVDFGWGGLFVMVLFGVFARCCARLALKGVVGVVPLYAYLCVVIFFMPVVNFMISAQGMYVINAFILAAIIMRHGRMLSQEAH